MIDRYGKQRNGRVLQVLGFHGLERVEVPSAQAGDIIAVTGVDELRISDTLCDRDTPEALPAIEHRRADHQHVLFGSIIHHLQAVRVST